MTSQSRTSGKDLSVTLSASILAASAALTGCEEKKQEGSAPEPDQGAIRYTLNQIELAETNFGPNLSFAREDRKEEPAVIPPMISYTVQPGDTLGRIVSRELGSIAELTQVIRQNSLINPDFNPDRLSIGQIVQLPARVDNRFRMDYSANPDLRAMLRYHEGVSSTIYECPSGKTTVGIGRNLSSRFSRSEISDYKNKTFSGEQIESWLTEDIRSAELDLERVFGKEKWFTELSDNRKMVLINMTFALGVGRVWTEMEDGQSVVKRTGLRGFTKMLEALAQRDFERAADEIVNSRFGREGGNRPRELARMMRDDIALSIPERFYRPAR